MIICEKFLLNYDEEHTSNVVSKMFEKLKINEMLKNSLGDFDMDKLMHFVKTSNFDCNH